MTPPLKARSALITSLVRAVLAVQFLTRLPLPNVTASAEDFRASIRWFPLAGLVVGLAVATAFLTGGLISPWLAALSGCAVWVWVTGALHLDGLADLADGLVASHGDPDKLQTVMKDPHVGSFGVCTLVLQLLAKTILLHELAVNYAEGNFHAQILALILLPALCRLGPLVWISWLPPLHRGLGSAFEGSVSGLHLMLWAAALLPLALLFAPALLCAPILFALWTLWLQRALGGVSGDCHGAGIEISEVGLLLALVSAGAL